MNNVIIENITMILELEADADTDTDRPCGRVQCNDLGVTCVLMPVASRALGELVLLRLPWMEI